MTDFKPMLAKDATLDKIVYPICIQHKLDGIRVSIVEGRAVTRTLKEVPNREIFEALSRPEFEGFDGEIIVGKPNHPDCYRTTVSFTMARDKVGQEWTYYVFDKWNHSGTFLERWQEVQGIHAWQLEVAERLVPVITQTINDEATLLERETDGVASGFEGVIIRDPNAPYKFGRSGKNGPLLKLKRFIDFEAEVIGVFEELHNGNEATKDAFGRTERSSHKANKTGKGRLGGLTVRAINGPAEGVEFNVGTGFMAVDRIALWEAHHGIGRSGKAEMIIGRIAKIKSFPIGVKTKPRHPVWLGWRAPEDM